MKAVHPPASHQALSKALARVQRRGLVAARIPPGRTAGHSGLGVPGAGRVSTVSFREMSVCRVPRLTETRPAVCSVMTEDAQSMPLHLCQAGPTFLCPKPWNRTELARCPPSCFSFRLGCQEAHLHSDPDLRLLTLLDAQCHVGHVVLSH